MCQSNREQAKLQQIKEGLPIVCTRLMTSITQETGKLNICTMPDKKEAFHADPIDIRGNQWGYFGSKVK